MTERGRQVAILLSGRGSNARALMEAAADGRLGGRISQVISDRRGAPGLDEARRRGVPAHVVAASEFVSRSDFERALAARLDDASPGEPPGGSPEATSGASPEATSGAPAAGVDVIALAGFMRVLSADFVRRFVGRIVNIHPSLLPAYKGLDTHRRVLEAGETRHGCSVHFVTAALDAGPLIMQSEIAVVAGETPAELAARVLREEHRIYPQAVALCCSGRITMREDRCLFDGRVLERPLGPDAEV